MKRIISIVLILTLMSGISLSFVLNTSASGSFSEQEKEDIIAAARKGFTLNEVLLSNVASYYAYGAGLWFNPDWKQPFEERYGGLYPEVKNETCFYFTPDEFDSYVESTYKSKEEVYNLVDECFYGVEITDESNYKTKPYNNGSGYYICTPEIYEYEGKIYVRRAWIGPYGLYHFIEIEKGEVIYISDNCAKLVFDDTLFDPEFFTYYIEIGESGEQFLSMYMVKDDGKWKLAGGSALESTQKYFKQVPQTGESTTLAVFSILSCVSLSGAAAVILTKKKKSV